MRNTVISRFPVKTAKTPFYIITATTAIATLSLNPDYLNYSPFISSDIRSALNGLVRSSRALGIITLNVVDYKYSLRSLSAGSDDYRRILAEVHLRSAKRTLKLCEANRGFYVKAGQLIAAMRQVPKEYSSTLSSLQDQAAPCDFKTIKQVLISNLGPDFADIFLSLDEEPIAAASIAQVHRALLKDNQEVAVKVQYPGIERQMKLDLATVSFLSESVTWFFPEYRFKWMASEFSKAIALELDFIQEARNSERTAKNFKNNPLIRVPGVFWEFTTSQVLTMEFCRGQRVDDLEYLKGMKINPTKVAKALVEVFAEMIFVHGFLHGDLHPGNILVSPEGPNGFSLVLLDHGTYKEFDEDFRVNYCQLWKALILLDSNKIQQIGEQFGVEKYSRYFPLIFTGRTIDSKAALGSGMSDEEKRNLKKDITSLRMEDLSSFMESLPSDFLAVLRADGLLKSLISKFGFSQRERLLSYAKYAVQGLFRKVNAESDVVVNVAVSKLISSMSYLQLRLLLEIVKFVTWSEDCSRWLIRRFKLLLNSTDCLMANVLHPSSTTTS